MIRESWERDEVSILIVLVGFFGKVCSFWCVKREFLWDLDDFELKICVECLGIKVVRVCILLWVEYVDYCE